MKTVILVLLALVAAALCQLPSFQMPSKEQVLAQIKSGYLSGCPMMLQSMRRSYDLVASFGKVDSLIPTTVKAFESLGLAPEELENLIRNKIFNKEVSEETLCPELADKFAETYYGKLFKSVAQSDNEDDDEESDSEFIKSVWKKIGPTVREVGKNYLRSKGIPLEDDEESDQQNNFNFGANVNNGQWGVNGQYQRTWNGGNTNLGVQGQYQQGSGYNAGVNFSHRWDSEEEDDEESDLRLPSWVNWENAQKAFQIYQQFRRDQDDEADEESDAEFIKSVWKKIGPTVREVGKNYLRSKGIPLQDVQENRSWNYKGSFTDAQFVDFFKGLLPYAQEAGKKFLASKGVTLSDEWGRPRCFCIRSPCYCADESDDEESDNPWLTGLKWLLHSKPAY